MDPAHDPHQVVGIDDRRHALVVKEPVAQVGVERLFRTLTHTRHARPGLMERAHELLLVAGEARLDEDDVHRVAGAERWRARGVSRAWLKGEKR